MSVFCTCRIHPFFQIYFRSVEPFCLETFKKKVPRGSDFKPPFFEQGSVNIAVLQDLAHQVTPFIHEDDTTEDFWLRMHHVKVGDTYKFRELTSGVMKMLVLPISNAEVERTFSVTKYYKNWHRSRLSTDLLKPMLHIKFGLKVLGKKPSEFEIPRKLMNFTSDIYK